MRMKLAEMTGEELLLLRVLHGFEHQVQIDLELDRRARLGSPAIRSVAKCPSRFVAAAESRRSLVA